MATAAVTVPLGVLLRREVTSEQMERPDLLCGEATRSCKGEDFTLLLAEAGERVAGDPSTSFSVFALFDGHNGLGAAIYAKENLLNNVLLAIPSGLSREEWLAVLPRVLVAAFVKTDKDFQAVARTSGTIVTFVIIDEWVVTVASVGDSRCILESANGSVYHLSTDHRFDCNRDELTTGYALQNMFEPSSCAVCQVRLKAGQGNSVHANPLQHEKLQGWQGPFLCQSCHEKKEAMEGKRRPRDSSSTDVFGHEGHA